MAVGLMSNFIVFPPTFLLVLLFKKGRWYSKRKNRIDLTIEELTEEGTISWKTEPYKRNLNPEHKP
jgi:hypothetical protein